jgi:hypothetical protein
MFKKGDIIIYQGNKRGIYLHPLTDLTDNWHLIVNEERNWIQSAHKEELKIHPVQELLIYKALTEIEC